MSSAHSTTRTRTTKLYGSPATASADLLPRSQRDFACTFGAPRVLDPVAAREFPVPLYRFVNNEDLVPDLPWPSLTDRYEHAGKRILLLASGQIAEDRHSPGLSRRIDRADTIGQGILPSGMVHDHAMENYLEKIARLTRIALEARN